MAKQQKEPQFGQPLFDNYDLYETEGKHSPGAGLYSKMDQYKSVKDFLAKKKKRKKKMARRLYLLTLAMDFPTDSQTTPILSTEDSYVSSIPISGNVNYTALPDPDGKTEDQLNFGQDLVTEELPDEELAELLEAMLRPAEADLLGMPDGVDSEATDADQTISPYAAEYATSDSGSSIYQNLIY